MRAVADGELECQPEFADEMSYCLGCLACQTACPAGVNYAELFETARSDIERARRRTAAPARRFWRGAHARLPVHASARRCAARDGCCASISASGSKRWRGGCGLTRLLPADAAAARTAGAAHCARSSRMQLIAPHEAPPGPTALSRGAADRLRAGSGLSGRQPRHRRRAAGQRLRVDTPPAQPCCGSLHAHNGELETGRGPGAADDRSVAARSLRRDHHNAGGCGSHLRHYGPLLADDPRIRERGACVGSQSCVTSTSGWSRSAAAPPAAVAVRRAGDA